MDCGWDKKHRKTNKVPLQFHHEDGDSKNNKEYNIKMICPNCHSLTDTYGSLNKGKGRNKRMKRYKEGKSW